MSPKFKWVSAVFVLGAVFLFFFSATFKHSAASFVFRKIKTARSLVLSSSYDFLASKNSLLKENTALRLKLADLETQKSLFEFRQEKADLPENFIEAVVIFRPPAINYDQLILGKGAEDGVKQGQLVLAGKNIIIGTVSEVFDDSSRVVSFSSYGIEQNVFLAKPGVSVTAVGMGNNELSITLPRDFQAESGSAVFSLTNQPYIVGYVSEIETPPSAPVKTLKVKQPFNIYSLYSVNILK